MSDVWQVWSTQYVFFLPRSRLGERDGWSEWYEMSGGNRERVGRAGEPLAIVWKRQPLRMQKGRGREIVPRYKPFTLKVATGRDRREVPIAGGKYCLVPSSAPDIALVMEASYPLRDDGVQPIDARRLLIWMNGGDWQTSDPDQMAWWLDWLAVYSPQTPELVEKMHQTIARIHGGFFRPGEGPYTEGRFER